MAPVAQVFIPQPDEQVSSIANVAPQVSVQKPKDHQQPASEAPPASDMNTARAGGATDQMPPAIASAQVS